MSDSLHPCDLGVIIRNIDPKDVPKIIDLRKISLIKLNHPHH
jgi:hypothetical protein